MTGAVLDASALLAYLRDESGAEVVADAIAEGAFISTVNLAEVLARGADRGADPAQLADDMRRRGLLDGALISEPFTLADAVEAARSRPDTRVLGLSLGDRACLALGARLGAPVLTADGAWRDLRLRLEIRYVR